MATPPRISISAKPKKPVTVDLVGVTYSIKPVKSALLLAISRHAEKSADTDPGALNRDINNIIKLMFVKPEIVAKVQARLADPEDDLDIEHIFEAVEAVTEDGTGDPTS